MDKIEVGEFVRTKKGIIFKATESFTNNNKDVHSKYLHLVDEIVKHSKNIADLIEVGDYVNGERVFKIEKDPFIKGQTDIFFNRDEVDYWGDRSLSQITDKDIKLIVTKEQFKSVMYEVEGEHEQSR